MSPVPCSHKIHSIFSISILVTDFDRTWPSSLLPAPRCHPHSACLTNPMPLSLGHLLYFPCAPTPRVGGPPLPLHSDADTALATTATCPRPSSWTHFLLALGINYYERREDARERGKKERNKNLLLISILVVILYLHLASCFSFNICNEIASY